MFRKSYLFWFVTVPSFILSISIILYYPFYLKPKFEAEIIKGSVIKSEQISNYFVNSFNLGDLNFEDIDLVYFEKISKSAIVNFELWKMRLFNPEGKIVFSTKSDEIGITKISNYFTEIVAKGNSYSKVVEKEGKTASGTVAPFDIVETYVPIMKDNEFAGAFEIYEDITEQNLRVKELFFHSYIISYPFILILLGIIFYTARKIEKGIKETNESFSNLKKAHEEIKTLQGIVPICASCKKIRDSKGYWEQVEVYVSKHTDAKFSHSLCDSCSDKLYGDEAWYKKLKEKKAKQLNET